MLDRVRHPNAPAKDRDLGSAVARLRPYDAMRKTIDDLPREPKR